MRPMSIVLAAAVAVSLAGVATAQAAPVAGPGVTDPNAPLGSAAHPIPQSSPTPADQAYRLKAGDPNVVSNAPIPDTPETRARVGQPMSRTGKRTPATGN